jgi:glycosyltransferase involved in cell wall biosynthesis
MEQRKNHKSYSPAGNKKISGVAEKLQKTGNSKVTIFSPSIVNNKSCKFYPLIRSNLHGSPIFHIPVFDIPIFNMISSIIFSIFYITSYYMRNPFNKVIYYNYNPETLIPALWCKFILKTKIYIEYEDGFFCSDAIGFLKRTVFIICEKVGNIFNDGAFLVTEDLKKRLKTKNYAVLPGFFDDELIEKARSISMEPLWNGKSKKRIMYSGRIDKERGVFDFLDAIKSIGEDYEIIVTGFGSGKEQIERLCLKQTNIKFMGFLNEKEYMRVLMGIHVFVSMQSADSAFSKASFPSKIMTYASTGAIVISTRVPGIERIRSFITNLIIIDIQSELSNIIHKIELKNYKRIIPRNYEFSYEIRKVLSI